MYQESLFSISLLMPILTKSLRLTHAISRQPLRIVRLGLVKKLSDNVITAAYTSSHVSQEITGDLLDVTKVYNSKQEIIDTNSIQPGKVCDVILEFAGLWFAKKTFGPSWNTVQVRVHEDPVTDTYPEEYAFVDTQDQ